MAVQFDPRAPSVHIMPQTSDSGSCCNWIAKICEWIRSFFSSTPTHSLLEQRIAKGKEFIDEAFRDVPRHNPDRTAMVCAMKYGDQIDVVFDRMGRNEDRFKAACYQRLEELLKRNSQVARGSLMVKSYYWEKLINEAYSTTDVRRELEFDDGQVGRVTRRELGFSPQLPPAYHPADFLLNDLGFR